MIDDIESERRKVINKEEAAAKLNKKVEDFIPEAITFINNHADFTPIILTPYTTISSGNVIVTYLHGKWQGR